ncbi:MAG: class I SAM-dependent methyltransferase [Natronosporangium sp.]
MTIDVERELTLDERTMVDFALGLRQRWSGTLYPALAGQYAQSGAPLPELPLYPWFSHLERAQQKLLWWAVSDAVLARADRLTEPVSEPAGPATLELDEHLVLPEWYTAYDIHMQPGGVWGDDLSAYVYELGARIVMLRSNDGYQFHELFAAAALPDLPGARRVVDVGCGFGKSTRPLVARYPGAEVVGVDLAAPNLRLAYAQATAAGLPVRYRQADVRATGLEPGSADLVTGTMVLHEMPASAVRETLAEAVRLLRPGGAVRFLEFGRTGDALRDATVYEHAERNNEPFLRELLDADLQVLSWCGELGLRAAAWVPFDERGAGLCPGGYPARSEWHFPWAVLTATREEDSLS